MSINYQQITIANISIVVVKKDIRNLHLSVLPPSGDVRITAPLTTSDDAIRLFAISKIAWVKKRRKSFAVQPRESPRDYVTGESHYFRGKRYLLNVLPGTNS